jgi:hypothetical protein
LIKRLSFVRRSNGVDPGEFAERWRAVALAADRAAPASARRSRLVHCVVRPGRADRPYHGVAIEWFADEAALIACDATESAARDTIDPVVDPATTLRVRVNSRTVLGDDDLVRWWSGGETRFVILGIVQRAPQLTREQFAAYWWDEHRPLANRLLPPEVQPDVYVHDYVLTGENASFDGVGEFYDPSIDRTRERTQWAERPGATETEEIAADEERFLIRDTRWALLTDATLIIPPVTTSNKRRATTCS